MDERLAGALAALVAYILWRRGVVQRGWSALFGPSDRAALPTTNQSMLASLIASGTANDAAQNIGTSVYPSPASGGDEWALSGCNRGNYSCLQAWRDGGGTAPNPTGTNAIIAAEPSGLAATIRQYGSDLYNYCLAWVNKTRQAAGLSIGPYGARTAADACSQLALRPGQAPPGATVCFKGGIGHIGIANVGDSYTSAGLIHGGLTTSGYLGNPNYIGWAA